MKECRKKWLLRCLDETEIGNWNSKGSYSCRVTFTTNGTTKVKRILWTGEVQVCDYLWDTCTLSKWWVKVTVNFPWLYQKLLGRQTFTKRMNLRRSWKKKSFRDQLGFWQIYAVHSCSHGFSYPHQQIPPAPPLVTQNCSRNVKILVSEDGMGVPGTKGRKGQKGTQAAGSQISGSSGCQQTVCSFYPS